ncbi:MAG: hypothetical protein TREMPRED_005253 [Tremellales sp. Tagirdzhanova-0007]|nr:MAG: hypothetical protein TREMPRED_005253 [Tremellales sp. Tagirdzhanova-0007]
MATQTDDTCHSVVDNVNPVLKELIASAKMLKNPNHSLHLRWSRVTWLEKSGVDRFEMGVETSSKHPLSASFWQNRYHGKMSQAEPNAYWSRVSNDLPKMLEELLSHVPPFRDIGLSFIEVSPLTGSITTPFPFDINGQYICVNELGEDDPETAPDSTVGNGSTDIIDADRVSTDTPAVNTSNQSSDIDNIHSVIDIDGLTISSDSNTAAGTNLAVDKVVPVLWSFNVTLDFRPSADDGLVGRPEDSKAGIARFLAWQGRP